MEREDTCKGCAFWEIIEDEVVLAQNNGVERGRCHEKSPTASAVVMPTLTALREVVPQVIEMTIWPITMEKMWCGKFEKATAVMEIQECITGKVDD